ncbi:TIGR03761 family integrating conjugative element protein, partial [Salmonella enterica]
MLGEKRSAFSPPVNRRSIDALKKGYFADENLPEGHITAVEGNDDSSEFGDVPAQSQTQTEEATAPEANELTDDIDTDMDDLSTLLPLSPEPE